MSYSHPPPCKWNFWDIDPESDFCTCPSKSTTKRNALLDRIKLKMAALRVECDRLSSNGDFHGAAKKWDQIEILQWVRDVNSEID